jgi:branched-chain amino acid transport system substrate-binding protein
MMSGRESDERSPRLNAGQNGKRRKNMKSRMRICFLVVSVIVVVLLMVQGPAFAQSKPAVTEWDIPFLSVLTGPVAFAGVPAVWGAEYAAKEINKAGGIRGAPVKFTKYDTAFNTAKAVSAMSRAVEGSLVVFGPMDGPGGDAAGPVAAEAKVPILAAFSFPDVRDRCKPWGIAYMTDSPEGSALAVIEWIRSNPSIKSVTVFYIPTDPAQVEEFKAVEAAMKNLGVKVLGPIELQTGQLDMGPPAVKAMNFKPDGYFCIMRSGEYTKVAAELYNRGIADGWRICATFAANSPSLLEVGKGKLNNTYIWNKIDPNLESPRWQAFVEAYKAEHSGQAPIVNTGPNYYDGVYATKEAFETLNITGDRSKLAEERKKIAEFLYNSKEFDGIQGKFKWVNGKRIAPYYLFQIRDNKMVKVGTLVQK